MKVLLLPQTTHSYSHYTIFPSNTFSAAAGRRPGWPRMVSAAAAVNLHRRHHYHYKDKIVVIMGATGSGKSSLSVELATRFPSEIINCDKMQVYNALDVTTNKISLPERQGVEHHLLGVFDPRDGELTPAEFRVHAGEVVSDIVSRRKLPLVAGGSNSFIYSMVANPFDPKADVFDGSDPVTSDLRYQCCFLWVDVSVPVLSEYLSKRVDDMLELGMVDELAEFYNPEEAESEPRTGLRKAIGVPEFDRFFKKYPPREGEYGRLKTAMASGDQMRRDAYEEAVRAIKDNTCRLAIRQMGKILRLRRGGWDLKRVDATAVFQAAMSPEGGKKRAEIWGGQVVEPSVKIVKRFLEE